MCFSPQRRAIIRHRNVQKCSEDYSFFTCSLPNVLFATAAYDFSTSDRPKVLRRLQFFCFSPQRRTIFRRVKSKKCFGPDVFCTFSLANVLFATAAYNFSTSERTKVVQTRHVLYILTCQCASRHSRVPFLNISNSKISPRLWCFAHFDLQMCFSPQRRAIFDFSADNMTPHPPL